MIAGRRENIRRLAARVVGEEAHPVQERKSRNDLGTGCGVNPGKNVVQLVATYLTDPWARSASLNRDTTAEWTSVSGSMVIPMTTSSPK